MPRSSRITGWMPRTRSRISLSADLASSCAVATSSRPASGSSSSLSRAAPSVAASATSRCWAPSWRSRSIRRRSASAESTAAVRRVCRSVTCSARRSSSVGPRRRSASAHSDGCRADRHPRRDEQDADHADGERQPPRRIGRVDLEEVELRAVAGEGADVDGQQCHRQRSAPRRGDERVADDAHRELEQVVGDLAPAWPSSAAARRGDRTTTVRVSGATDSAIVRRNAPARDRASRARPRGHHQGQPQPSGCRARNTGIRPIDSAAITTITTNVMIATRQADRDVGGGPEQSSGTPPRCEWIHHDPSHPIRRSA